MTNAPSGWYTDPDDAAALRWWDGTQWTEQRAPAPIAPVARAGARSPIATSTWVWTAGAALGFLLFAVILGIGQAMVLLAVGAIIAAIIALSGRHVPWLRTQAWKLTTLGAGILLLIGGTAAAAATSPRAPVGLADRPSSSASSPDTPTPTPTPVVTTKEVVVTEAVPFERVTQDDAGLDIGTSSVVQAGVSGTRTITYTVTYVDGVEFERVVTGDEMTIAAVSEITANGIRQPAPPPPAPVAGGGGCDPNYSGACVPISSDVDCAGGSGNGPAYVQGPVTVVGTDIYDLDRDGDGIACD